MIVVLGSAEAAREIFHKSSNTKTPEGWTKIGSGAFRRVYRGPDGFVYKVCYNYYGGKNDNDDEYRNYCSIINNGTTHRGWRIPRVYAYKWIDSVSRKKITVNVMDFVEGIHEFDREKEPYGAFDKFGLLDSQIENYILSSDGRRYIIDLAC